MIKRVSFTVGVAVAIFIVAIVVPISVYRSRMAKEHELYASLLLKPDGIANVGDLLKLKPDIREVFFVTNASSVSVVVTLEPPKGTRHTYSGPPAYIFDENGRLVGWSEDTGDDNEFWRKWPISSTNEVSKERVYDIVEPVASPEPPPRASGSEDQG